MIRTPRAFIPKVLVCLFVVPLLLIEISPLFQTKVLAAEMGPRSQQMSNSIASATGVTYNITFTLSTPGPLGSVEFEFCSNSALPDDVCVAPIGMDASNAVFSSESGISGFLPRSETANEILITRPPTAISAILANAVFDNITNPSTVGSFYTRVYTFATSDGTGSYTDYGGMANAITSPVNVKVQVPPYLLFCTGNSISGTDCSTATGDFIELGQLTTSHTSSGQSQMVIATNAQNGYNISSSGTTLTSGNNTIPPLSVDAPSQTGISQFGINLRANSKPSVGQDPIGPGSGAPTAGYDQPNLYEYSNGATVASFNNVEDGRKFTVSYVTNISKEQAAGIYASTFTFIAFSNF